MKISEMSFDKHHPIKKTLPESEHQELLAQLPGWKVESNQLLARFRFANFVDALAFTNRVGDLAESYNHHPAITTEYGRVTVSWWTHTAGGVTGNDFVLAAETSKLASPVD